MQLRKLYFREGKSDKVYVATLEGSTVKCAWGRRGATLQAKTFDLRTPGAAADFYHSKLGEKLAKGYRDLEGGPTTGGPKPCAPVVFAPAPVRIPPQPAPAPRPIATTSGRKFRFDD